MFLLNLTFSVIIKYPMNKSEKGFNRGLIGCNIFQTYLIRSEAFFDRAHISLSKTLSLFAKQYFDEAGWIFCSSEMNSLIVVSIVDNRRSLCLKYDLLEESCDDNSAFLLRTLYYL